VPEKKVFIPNWKTLGLCCYWLHFVLALLITQKPTLSLPLRYACSLDSYI